MRNLRISRPGFTLVELLIVIIVIAVLAAIAIPKFVNSSARSKEASLHADLKLVRDGIELFHNDTGYYPAVLTDLAVIVAPPSGKDSTGTAQNITAANWKGPYLATLPEDPVSGNPLVYSVTSPTVGQVNSSMSGADSANILFSTY